MNSLGLFMVVLQFISGSVSDTQSHIFGVFNIFAKNYSTTDLATSLNSIIGPIRNPNSPELEIGARAAIIMDDASGKILFAKSSTTKLPMASITKLMTALVALDNLSHKTDTIITVPAIATNETGSRMKLETGERITSGNLIKGMLIASANDAAATLASTTAKNREQFVIQMNAKAKTLGLTSTNFANPTGFDAPNHYSSALDLARLTQEALKNPVIAQTVAMQKATITDISGNRKHPVTTTNHLLAKYDNVIGVKTGTTDEAGLSLITAATSRSGQTVIVVLLASPDRFGEGGKALDWALTNHSWIEPV